MLVLILGLVCCALFAVTGLTELLVLVLILSLVLVAVLLM